MKKLFPLVTLLMCLACATAQSASNSIDMTDYEGTYLVDGKGTAVKVWMNDDNTLHTDLGQDGRVFDLVEVEEADHTYRIEIYGTDTKMTITFKPEDGAVETLDWKKPDGGIIHCIRGEK